MSFNYCKRYANNGNPYCVHTKYAKYVQEQVLWEQNGFVKFINNGKWCYDFECEDTIKEYEQSFLAQVVFGNLLMIAGYLGYSVNRNKISLHAIQDMNIKFSMDVMNNPKDSHRFGKEIKEKCLKKWEKWNAIYHTIGNFTFIPNRKGRGRHLQNIHNDLDERWDLLLKYCKENWNSFSCEQEMTFAEYMKISLQQIYYKEIYNDLICRVEGKDLNSIL